MNHLKFTEIFKQNNELGKTLTGETYSIGILSNCINSQLNPILELSLRLEGVLAKCESGDYDNILQDTHRFNDKKLLVTFWEAANLIDGFQYKCNLLSASEVNDMINRFKSELDYFFLHTASIPLVIINTFSSTVFNYQMLKQNNFDLVCSALNEHLKSNAPSNTIVVDIEKVFSKLSVDRSIDLRNYYSSKSLYSLDFYKAYVNLITPAILSVCGKNKKAIILDCDNTLWEGIIGEDGMNGIHMSASNSKGAPYEEVQYLVKELVSKGIIIGLNSKNNEADVKEVIANHPDIKIKEDDIVIHKINWNDKVSNLKEIAADLNIGIDSLVFVDDSDFEINLVKEYLPQVKCIQVPKEHYLYPSVVRSQLGLFYNKNESKEDAARIKMYKQEQKREHEKSTFASMAEYLQSLNLEMGFYINTISMVPRIAQLTQKTNQFNLTTKRYTENEIRQLMEDNNSDVFAFDLKDKYGDFGITGVAISKSNANESDIDTLLMSCRVLGRTVENRFMDEIIKYLQSKNISRINSTYVRTLKNDQVKDYYDKMGFELTHKDANKHTYELNTNSYTSQSGNFIKIHTHLNDEVL